MTNARPPASRSPTASGDMFGAKPDWRQARASESAEPPVPLLRYLDVVLVVIATPVLLLIGVPAAGYCGGAAVWIVLRALGVAIDRGAASWGDRRSEISLRLGYMLARLFALALTVVLVRRAAGRDDGLAALVVIAFAFTVQLATLTLSRPRSR